MTMPRIALFAFALWTLAVPLGAVGVYRWSRILRGKQAIHTFRSDAVEGADWYRRAMRAHANCVENLPVFGAIVWTLDGLALRGSVVDALAALVFVCRVGQSTVHLGWTETARSVSIRFTLFFAQVLCMGALSAMIVALF
jgi:uncharacterized MAPEG superfamily protein